ncbi:MAG TPA: hypothetical protein VFS36_04430 [Chitinophagaceae bacterium]|nr:hypothetical protein [Chitinophagaceae bacterium]
MKKYFFIALLFSSFFSAKAQNNTTSTAGDFIIFPGNDITLPPNGTDSLWIKEIINNMPADANISTAEWTIDGKEYSKQDAQEGNFKIAKLQFYKGVYKAPAKVPPHNPVLITASFQPEGETTKIILYCRIHIIDKENYFYISSNNTAPGTLYEIKEPMISSMRMESAYYFNDQWSIGANGFRKTNDEKSGTQPLSVGASIIGNGTGIYPWTIKWNSKQGLVPPLNTVTITGIDKDGNPFQYFSGDCIPHGDYNCGHIALQGSTTITVFDKQKRIIKGYFSGQLVSPTGQYVWASGAFSVKMK